MIINLNGGLFLNNDNYFFDNLEIEIEEDNDFLFGESVDDCDECGYCNYDEDEDFCDCEFCNCDCDDDYDDEETLDELIEGYADTIYEFCDDDDFNMEKLLTNFLRDVLDNLFE